ncbi:MAG: hypothetical protein K2M94_07755 [Paramuribaculum sp.]|nr:hypothetical protein [Paramuribaculum sp.]
MRLSSLVFIGALLCAVVTLGGCDTIDDDRIPPAAVSITFNTVGDWNIYGVTGAGDYREFILTDTEHIPLDYPYKGLDRTGYGGVLLVCDPIGEPLAYDLSCPVEAKPTVRIYPDTESQQAGIAVCPKCGSRYNLYGAGAPVSGEAHSKHYGLRRYSVTIGGSFPYAVIKN